MNISKYVDMSIRLNRHLVVENARSEKKIKIFLNGKVTKVADTQGVTRMLIKKTTILA